jgi:hypothetical protein
MSVMPHEGIPSPDPEKELQVSLEEARAEVSDTVESIIIASISKAHELSVGGIDELSEVLKSDQELSDDQLNLLSQRGRRLVGAIQKLRSKKLLMAAGLREDLTNEELVELVDQLASLNEVTKTYVGDRDFIQDADSLISVVENITYALRTKTLVLDGKSTLSAETIRQSEQSET